LGAIFLYPLADSLRLYPGPLHGPCANRALLLISDTSSRLASRRRERRGGRQQSDAAIANANDLHATYGPRAQAPAHSFFEPGGDGTRGDDTQAMARRLYNRRGYFGSPAKASQKAAPRRTDGRGMAQSL
jgi:hypothetical protein